MKRWLSGCLRLLRLHNAAAAALSVFVGYSLARPDDFPLLLIAAVATSTISGNVINDYFDLDIDAVNRPERPIPSGTISDTHALVIYLIFIAATVVLMLGMRNRGEVLWIGAWLVLLFLYSSYLKRKPLIGNIAVSLVSASGFLLGSYSGGRIEAGVLPASFTFLFVFAREIVKDVDDLPGDTSCGARTLPVVLGVERALKLSSLIFFLLVLTFPLPFLLNVYGAGYGLVMLLTVVPILVVSAIFALGNRRLTLVSTLLKVGMFFGSVAFYLG